MQVYDEEGEGGVACRQKWACRPLTSVIAISSKASKYFWHAQQFSHWQVTD